MRDQHLHIAARVLNAAFFKIAGPAIDGLQNRSHAKRRRRLSLRDRIAKSLDFKNWRANLT